MALSEWERNRWCWELKLGPYDRYVYGLIEAHHAWTTQYRELTRKVLRHRYGYATTTDTGYVRHWRHAFSWRSRLRYWWHRWRT